MKITSSNNSWAQYSKTISDFISPKGRRDTKARRGYYKKLRPYNQFMAWPLSSKRHISTLSGYALTPQLDIKPVEQFLKRHASLGRTEPLLRTSPLLSQSANEGHGLALQKAVAIKRMASLMHETISAMKSLAHNRASHHRG